MTISRQNSTVDSPARSVRDRLLDSAEHLFAERGFDGTSIRDLAAAAGCNIGKSVLSFVSLCFAGAQD